MIWLNLWCLPPAFFVCRRAAGEAFTRHSLRPLILGGSKTDAQPGRSALRECEATPLWLFDRSNLQLGRHCETCKRRRVRRSSKSEGGSSAECHAPLFASLAMTKQAISAVVPDKRACGASRRDARADPGPITTARRCCIAGAAFFATQTPVVMGPGFRRDDGFFAA